MGDIVKRLRASVLYEAYDGNDRERGICARQMTEAAAEIERLRAENEQLRDTEKRLLEHIEAKTGDCVQDETWDDVWHLVHPDDSSWEYPGQVVREITYEIQRLRLAFETFTVAAQDAQKAARWLYSCALPDAQRDAAKDWPWLEEV